MKPEFDKTKPGAGNAYNKDRNQNAPGGKQEGTRPMGGNVTQRNQNQHGNQPGNIDRDNLGNLGRKDKTDKR